MVFKPGHISDIGIDPAKDEINQAKHGISLTEANGFDWDTALEREDDRLDYGELRFVAIDLIDARLYVLAFTEGSDDDAVRIVSLRSAEKHEMRYCYGQV